MFLSEEEIYGICIVGHIYYNLQVRREKISERMKFLQDLVPGCSKVGSFDGVVFFNFVRFLVLFLLY